MREGLGPLIRLVMALAPALIRGTYCSRRCSSEPTTMLMAAMTAPVWPKMGAAT